MRANFARSIEDVPDGALQVMAFDLLFQDGVGLRGLPLSERLRDLGRLLRKSRVPTVKLVESFPIGSVLLDHCDRLGLDGIVSKRLASRYASGPSRSWVKTKCPQWRRANADRHKLFEKPAKVLGPSEREKALEQKRAELARVQAALARPASRRPVCRLEGAGAGADEGDRRDRGGNSMRSTPNGASPSLLQFDGRQTIDGAFDPIRTPFLLVIRGALVVRPV